MRTPSFVTAIALASVFVTGQLSAQSALKDEPKITEGIIQVGMAIELSEKCDDIDARLFRGFGFLQSLKGQARDLGYSDAQIDAFVDDRAEKNRLEGIARARLADLGAIAGDEASYCAVGRAQIAANTRVGWLLR